MSSLPADPVSMPSAPRQKGRPVLAWLVILGTVGFLVWRGHRAEEEARGHFDPVVMEMQARLFVGMADLFGNRGGMQTQAATLNRGPYGQRLRYAILAGELSGKEAAGKLLDALGQDVKVGKIDPPLPKQEHLAGILRRVYAAPGGGPAAPLPPEEKQELHQYLGWFGDLAVASLGPDQAERERVLAAARRTAAGMLVYLGLLGLLGMAGVALGVVLVVLWLLGRLGGGLHVGTPHAGVYAETFAAYLVGYFGLGLALARVPVVDNLRPLLGGAAALAALAVLGWPVLRGVPWRQVRADIGLTLGRRPGLEPVVGVGCYLAALPLLFIGLMTFLVVKTVLKYFGYEAPDPSHPINDWVVQGGWGVRLQLVFDACVVAPLVEETMFRGVLYRHLREASAWVRPAVSVVFSAAVVSLVFAVIHPQGLLFAPVLMGLATAFALAREWRGTLVPPMIAHGINNGMVMALLLVTAG